MKKFVYILLAVCIFVSSCTEDIGVYRDLVQEGEPVEFTLDFSVGNLQDKSIESRSGNDHTVNNIYLFVFEAKNGEPGMLKTKKLYSSDELKGTNGNVPSDDGNESNSGIGKLSVTTTQGESFIYAVANIDFDGTSGEYNQEGIKKSLENLQVGDECFDELNEISVSYNVSNNEILLRTSSYYLMSGMYQAPVDGKYTREKQSCIIGPKGIVDGNGNAVGDGKVRLYRMDAWVDFNIYTAEGITFTPTKYRVVNLPVKSRLIVGENDITTENENDYVDNLEREIVMSDGKYSFSFYLFENRKKITDEGKSLGQWEYKHREVTTEDYEYVDDDGNYINPDFTYAPADATYIEIEGNFSGTTKKDPFISGKEDNPVSGVTKYRIHLGDFSDHNYKDFNTLRNYHYTYKVTIKGVDDIIVEVESANDQKDTANGATGEILFQPSANNFVLDSHFEVKQFTVNKSDLENWNLDDQDNGMRTDFAYVTRTCYGESTGTYENETSELKDIYWVEFVRNQEPEKGYLSYPSSKKMNVKELLKELHDWKQNGYRIDDEDIESLTYTIFVDEYYYTDDKIEKLGGQGKGSKNWKDFCNQPNRVMYIGQRRKYSDVSPSTLTESICFISQRSIQTIYNTKETEKTKELYSAWGVETVNETPDVKQDDSSVINDYLSEGKNDRQNGYANQYDIWGKSKSIDQTWDTYIERTSNEMKDKNFKSIYACLLRNRDENGNGKIDTEELKWYLPAIYQYGDLFLGELGITPEARQYYFGESEGWTYNYHMLSSTFEDNKQYRNLAEEGFAFSNSNYDYVYENGKLVSSDIEKLQIRCARNLGGNESSSYYDNGGEKAKEEVRSYVQINESQRIINLDFLNEESKRKTYREDELRAEHSHLSLDNSVYNKFEYGEESIDEVWADEVSYGARNAESTNPYASIVKMNEKYNTEGWRAPSQRELMILVFQGVFKDVDNTNTTDYDESWYLSRTVFEWGGIMAGRNWIEYPSEWGDENAVANADSKPVKTIYYYRKKEGDDPDRDFSYRYSYGIITSGTTFGLKQWSNYTGEKGKLLPVRDVK